MKPPIGMIRLVEDDNSNNSRVVTIVTIMTIITIVTRQWSIRKEFQVVPSKLSA